ADRVRADPVADLQAVRPDPRVQAAPAQHALLGGIEDRVDRVRAEVELAAELAQELDFLGEGLRLVAGPRHPRPQVLEARVDRLLEQRRVTRIPAADDEAWRHDAVRGAADGHPGTIPAGLVTFPAMRILLTNDDGITSRGLFAAKRALDEVGEVSVIAPDSNRSAVGRGITIDRALTVTEVELRDGSRGYA